MGKNVDVHIGDLIEFKKIKEIGDLKMITNYLYNQTYNLDPENKLI